MIMELNVHTFNQQVSPAKQTLVFLYISSSFIYHFYLKTDLLPYPLYYLSITFILITSFAGQLMLMVTCMQQCYWTTNNYYHFTCSTILQLLPPIMYFFCICYNNMCVKKYKQRIFTEPF